MSDNIAFTAVLFALAGCVATRTSLAQETAAKPAVDTSVARRFATTEKRFPRSASVRILRQQKGPQSQARREELADSIIARAVRRTVVGVEGTPEIQTLMLAGVAGVPGTPEPRALDWLIRVHRNAQAMDVRTRALSAISILDNPMRVVPYLREVTESPTDPTANYAAFHLVAIANTPTNGLTQGQRDQLLTMLRAMWEQRTVKNVLAAQAIADMAAMRGWRSATGERPPPGLQHR